MFAEGRKKGTVRFSVQAANGIRKVEIAGDFTAWRPAAMRKQKDGTYAITVELASGTHEYKFVMDGQWVADPDNNAFAVNPYGTVNSVASVGKS